MMEEEDEEDTKELYEQDLFKLTDKEKLERASALRDSGKELFLTRDIEGAFWEFSKGVKYLILIDSSSTSPALLEKKRELEVVMQNNLAGCHLLRGNWEYVIELANAVLEIEPDNVKALYRRGFAQTEIQDFELAESDLKRALALDPNNGEIERRLELLRSKIRKYNEKYAEGLKKLFISTPSPTTSSD